MRPRLWINNERKLNHKVISKSEDDGFLWPQPEAVSSERVKQFSAYFALRTQVLKICEKVVLSVNVQALKYRVSRKKKETLNMMFVHTYGARIERQEKRWSEGDVKRLLNDVYMWSRIWSMGLIQLCFLVSFSLCSLFRDRSQEEKHCKAWFICSICTFDGPDKAYWLTNDSAWCKKIAPLQRWSSSKGTASCLWPQVVSHVFFCSLTCLRRRNANRQLLNE